MLVRLKNNSVVIDPLPSWVEGDTKTAIIKFVNDITNDGGSKYIHPNERIATFDNDGTLWCEQPVAQLEFVSYQINKMANSNPGWKDQQPYKSILEGDKNYLINDIILILAIRISKTKGRLCNTISNQSLGAIPEAPPATHFSLPQRCGSGKNGAIPRVRHPKIMIFQLLYNDFIS